jgi:hypothetical protein
LTNEAQENENVEERKKAAKAAIGIIDTALGSYPADNSLLESRYLLTEMVVSITVSDRVEKAERATFEGNYSEAKALYRDALFELGRDNIQNESRERAAARIKSELERIRGIEIPR